MLMKKFLQSRRDLMRDAALASGGLVVAALWGCGLDEAGARLASEGGDDEFVTLYDTHAMATYFDGSLGPRTGVITVDMVLAGVETDLRFWHGHGGIQHHFRILPEHFTAMRCLKKVFIETTMVDGHKHKLFVDFSDARWRVAGAQPVRVPRVACESSSE
jgi:hypothetical protein